ncbi:biotin--[acetyl-CoA-carboxylase] ligase [Homoserinibacter sp. YIM 151385]|uniref:biotin--[acetyl-CoA-carboxylase] ligase n=1 Tax=Homoserinibacter sp. YIM 151385 TaxID=2985506 RepID=UPI0022F01B1D|nr:biotin--[acetyl-CoA-carboxylase] ligase [Homoserinibacter sp. YIM 151385]WBU36797.1 biotin--[acetyl-CoA-carboxylase] ligase [Homoserinibacter sp. YIM 151385]
MSASDGTGAGAGAVRWLARSPSTNSALAALATADPGLPHLTAVATLEQTAGRGRLDRVWTAPAGASLAASVLIRLEAGRLAPEQAGWLPIAAGVAMTAAVRAALPAARRDAVQLKWPNDVLVGERKICGILAELLVDRSGAVVGSGVNTAMTAAQLPVETATSLAIEGGRVDAAALLDDYLGRLDELVRALAAHDGDAERSGLRASARAACGTLGRRVRVELPGREPATGLATDLDAAGRLHVVLDDGTPLDVAAGDVVHLRHR